MFWFLKFLRFLPRATLEFRKEYKLSKMCQKIEEKHGFEECKLVRETHDDEAFIRKYLDEDLCRELNLFSYSYDRRRSDYTINDISDKEGWKSVRDDLIKNVGINSIPIVYVEDYDKRMQTLCLRHEHDGRDLEISYANKVYDHIRYLWDDDIIFTALIEGEIWEF